MHTTDALLKSHPVKLAQANQDQLLACLQACLECSQTCTACADACLAEDMVVELRACIRTNQDCATICSATAEVLSRLTASNAEVIHSLVDACKIACRVCGDECERHAEMHDHCRICAEACRRCEQACDQFLATLTAATR